MRKGDRLPITVGGIEIGFAEVESLENGEVTIYVPPQRAKAAVRVSLDAPVPTEPTTETVITGVDRAVPPVVESAPEPVSTAVSTEPTSVAPGEGTEQPVNTPAPPAPATNTDAPAVPPAAPETSVTTNDNPASSNATG